VTSKTDDLERALRISEGAPQALDARTKTLEAAAQALLGGLELACQRYQEALTLVEQAHGVKSHEALECRWRLGRFLLNVERPEAALIVLEKLAVLSDKNREIHPGERSDFLHAYAAALEQCGRPQDAEWQAAEARRLLKSIEKRRR
jgi:tetratricopeptide (TPR) repeat protein